MGQQRAETNDGHISFHLDRQTLAAVEQAAARDERTKSAWLRVLIKRELRNLGLLQEPSLKTKRR